MKHTPASHYLIGLLLLGIFMMKSTLTIAQATNYKTYSIQLMAYSKVLEDDEFEVALKQFGKLRNLGYVYETSYLSPNNFVPSRFYIGSYVGIHTAKRILKQVKRYGFKDAFIVEEVKTVDPAATQHYTVVQIGAYKRLLMNNFKKLSDEVGQGYVSITYSPKDRNYKVLLTCFRDGDTTDEETDAKKYGFPIWKRDIRDIYSVK